VTDPALQEKSNLSQSSRDQFDQYVDWGGSNSKTNQQATLFAARPHQWRRKRLNLDVASNAAHEHDKQVSELCLANADDHRSRSCLSPKPSQLWH